MEFPSLQLPTLPNYEFDKDNSFDSSGYKILASHKVFGGVHSISISPNQKSIACAHSSRIIVLSTTRGSKRFQISKFKDIVACIKWREDGRLLAGGTNDGVVWLFLLQSIIHSIIFMTPPPQNIIR